MLRCMGALTVGMLVAASVARAVPEAGEVEQTSEASEQEEAWDPPPVASLRSVALFDDLFGGELESRGLSGAVVVMVEDGRTTLARGYGLADRERGRLFSPGRTTLAVGSITKLITALALLQLEAANRVRLDADVNRFLETMKVPATFAQPITPFHLLTHTDGFEFRVVGNAVRSITDLKPLAEAARVDPPRRILKPGRHLTYGDYASNLAGLIVEEASDLELEAYVERHLFQPLGMRRSTLRRPLPDELHDDLEVAYTYAEGVFTPTPEIHAPMAPAGALHTTANDMSSLLLAMLSRTLPGLSDSSYEKLFQSQFREDPGLAGITCGLFELEQGGLRALYRDGDGLAVRSRLVVVPEKGVGLFVHYNGDDDLLREEALRRWLEILGEGTSTASRREAASEPAELVDPAHLEGVYRPIQWDRTTVGKILLWLGHQIAVRDLGGGRLEIEVLGLGEHFGGFDATSQWTAGSALFYSPADGSGPDGRAIRFSRDPQCGEMLLFTGSNYHGTFRRLRGYEHPALQGALVVLVALLLASTLVWPIGALVARLRRKPHANAAAATLGRALAFVASCLFFLFGARAFDVLFVRGAEAGMPPIVFGLSDEIQFALWSLYLPVGLSAPLVVLAAQSWRRCYWGRVSRGVVARCHFTAVVAALCLFTVLLHHWNLLGVRL